MEDQGIFDNYFQSMLVHELHRIANAQERLLEIAQEARQNRNSMTEKMQQMFKQPLDIPPSKEHQGA